MDLNRPASPLQSQNQTTPRNRKTLTSAAIAAAALLLTACGGGAAPQGA
ncbi:ABC transporter substrate-binding protein, partial [Paenarthrobacter sp. CM16]|nr:ABC transporter substrate-binding protein [Paenarthrobacter sp. CM16]